jgi:MFS family permease
MTEAVAQGGVGGATTQERVPWRAWWGLGVLTTIGMFAQMDRIALAILLQPIKAELHLSDTQLGLLSGLAFALFYATLGLPLARYADRGARTKLLAACLAIWTVMTTLCGFARNFPQLFIARMGVGVGEAGCLPTSHSLIGDWFPRARRTMAIAIFQCGGAVGISVGTFIVGMLAQTLGWRACLQLVGLAGVPFAILVLFTVREPQRPRLKAAEAGEATRQAVGALLNRPAYVHLMLAYSIAAIPNMGLGQWIPTFLMRSFGFTMMQVGTWAGLATAVGSIFGLLGGGLAAHWLARRDRRWELWIPALAIGASFPVASLMVLSPWVGLTLTLKVLNATLSSIASGVAIAAVQSFVEPHRRATAVSLVIFLHSILGLGLGPYLIGLASDLLAPQFGVESLRYGMQMVVMLQLWSVAHFVMAARRSHQDRVD